MERKASRWRDVELGTVLLAGDGVAWKVTDTPGRDVILVNRAGKRVRQPRRPSMEAVTVLIPTQEEALSVLHATLGAVPVEESPWVAKRFGWDHKIDGLKGMRSHLRLMHHPASMEAEKTATALRELHDWAHEAEHWIFPHTHEGD